MTTCTHHGCTARATWRHDTGDLCRTHAAEACLRTGRPATVIPTVLDLVDRLEAAAAVEASEYVAGLCLKAAAEIRSLRERVAIWEGTADGTACVRS